MVAQSILLLNASYEPLTVVTLARAVKLLLRGRAEAVSASPASSGARRTSRAGTIVLGSTGGTTPYGD
jgi:hypothetical protein